MATALGGAAALTLVGGTAYRASATDVHITVVPDDATTHGGLTGGAVQFIVEYINF